MRTARLGVLVLALVLVFCTPAATQTSEGSIEGTVADPSGAVIVGASLSARHVATSVAWTVVTDRQGHFLFLSLPVGVYEITVNQSGFATLNQPDVVVTIGARITLPLTLQVAGSKETVAVSVPLVQPTRSQVTLTIEQNLISGLPVNGRAFTDFIMLVPGVSRVGIGISVAGQRGLNLMLLDGADDHNSFYGHLFGIAPTPYQVSLEAVQEFQVNVNAYSATYGRAGAGVVNVVTKAGTNDPHSNLFWYYRDKSLTASDPILHEKVPLHVNQFGGSAGGPIRRNTMFFFANYDGQRRIEGNATVLNLPPNFALSPDPAKAVFQQRALDYLTPRAAPWSRTYDQDILLARVDWQVGAAHRLTGRWNRHRFSGANLEAGTKQDSLEHTGASGVNDDTLAVSLTSSVSPSLLNVLRVNYLSSDQGGVSNSINPEAMVFEGGQRVLNVGRFTPSPRMASSRRTEWSDTLSFLRGRHAVETGLNVLADRVTFSTEANFSGSYRFNSLESFGRSLEGVPAPAAGERYIQAFSGEGTPGVRVHLDFVDVAVFLQDAWRVGPELTLNLGVRYDVEAFSTPSVKNPSPVLAAAGIDTSIIPVDWNNVSPRLGVAWTPRFTPRLVIRAGYGIFYGRTATGHATKPFFQNGTTVQTRTFAAGTPDAALIPAYPNTLCGPPDPSGAPPQCPAPIGGSENVTIQTFSPEYGQPRVHQGSAGIDYQWGPDVAVSVSYLNVRGRDLHRYRDINLSTPALPATIGIAKTDTVLAYHIYPEVRPLAGFDRVLQFESSGRSTYDGMAVQVMKRLSHDFQVQAAYTVSRALDDISNFTPVSPGQGDAQFLADSFDNSQNWGPAPADRRHLFVLGGIWALEDYADGLPTAARRALGGWQVSGLVTAQSGVPYSGFVNFDLNNDDNAVTDRTPGVGSNAYRRPAAVTVDLRLTRTVPLGAKAKLLLFCEAFNLFNRANVNELQTGQYRRSTSAADCGVAGTPCLVPQSNFGEPTGSTGPRIVQLALKVVF